MMIDEILKAIKDNTLKFKLVEVFAELTVSPVGSRYESRVSGVNLSEKLFPSVVEAAEKAMETLDEAYRKDEARIVENYDGPCKCLKCAVMAEIKKHESKTEPVINKL